MLYAAIQKIKVGLLQLSHPVLLTTPDEYDVCSDLLVRYSSSLISSSAAETSGADRQPAESSVKLRSLVSSCLDGIAQATSLFCTRYSQHLARFLTTLGMVISGH